MARSARYEFSKPMKLEMFRRAGGLENLCCEGCGLPLRGKPFEYDHTLECWEMRERKVLTAGDGKLLGYCCHKPKTAKKTAERAHGNRIIEDTARAKKKSTWRSKPDGYKFNWKLGRYVSEKE